MAKRNSFSLQLDEMGNPVAPDGRLLQQAEAGKGQSDAMRTNADTASIAFLGTQVIEAVKGKMEADEEGEIQRDVLDDITGKKAEAAINANNEKLRGKFLDSAASDDFAGAATKAHFEAEAHKFALAQMQGIMPRDEAITKIGEIVKRYSAQMPGWAGDFRKRAAELTGVSNIDVLGIHNLLTQKSAREKIAEKEAAAQLELDQGIARDTGLKLDQITDEVRGFYRSHKQLALASADKEARRKLRTLSREENDEDHNDGVSMDIAGAVSGLAADFTALNDAHIKSTSPIARDEAMKSGAKLAAKITDTENLLIRSINARTAGPNPMRREEAEKRIASVRKDMEEWRKGVQTAEGYNLWVQTIKNSEGDANLLAARIKLANPLMMQINLTGMSAELTRTYMSVGADAFEKMHGKVATDAIKKVLEGGGDYLGNLSRVLKGETDIANMPPDQRIVAYNDIVGGLQNLAKDAGLLDDKKSTSVKNGMKQWMEHVNLDRPEDLKKFSTLLTSPEGLKLLGQLDDQQRVDALRPLFDRVGTTTVKNTTSDVYQRVNEWNGMESNKRFGHKIEVVVNPLTGLLESKVTPGEKPAPSFGSTPGGAATFSVNQYREPMQLADVREAKDTIDKRLRVLNTIPKVIAATLPLVNAEAKPSPSEMVRQIHGGIVSGKPTNIMLTAVGELPTQDVPRNAPVVKVVPPSPTDFPKVSPELQAERDQRAAELYRKETPLEDLKKSAEEIKLELKKPMEGSSRLILKRELDIIEKALSL
jgi:hypothetical protein